MTVRKTITVTHQNAINYGAVLQSYALQRKLSELGIDDEIVDLKRPERIYFRKMTIGRLLLSDIFNNMVNLFYMLKTQKRVFRFREFVENNIKTTRYYETVEEVIERPPAADTYITGSDQTFNTYWGIKPASFLRFGSKDTQRISYASSMGISAVKDEYLDEFVSAICDYSFLSVREKSAADYISKLCSVPCSVNIDPTLLLTKEDWTILAGRSKAYGKVVHKQYILVYLLLYNPLVDDAIKTLKKETGLEVVVLNPNSRCFVKGDRVIRDAGPLEFLNLFRNAEYILTTSFHGACFSVIFQKKFFSFIRNSGETRITNILSMLNLNNRIITDISKMSSGDEIAYNRVNEIIEIERKKASDYLAKALGV